ncbi:MAG: adenylate/guanylate cyclase domain-containing protein [Alphaproteobacteria bacterium]|nr:adenylate/guanylate cyclase domain-containing protein [Alphaproteobacteria bacterium]
MPFLVLGLAAGALLLDESGFIERGRNLVFDTYQHISPRQYRDPKEDAGVAVRYLDIDEESLARYGQWPWPRSLMARLVWSAKKAGVRLLVFDMVFAEADRTSPERIGDYWPQEPEFDAARATLAKLPSHETKFATALQAMPAVMGVILTGAATAAELAPKSGINAVGAIDPKLLVPGYRGAIVNLPLLEEAGAGLGAFNIDASSDGIIRRTNLLFRSKDRLVPSLALEALRLLGKPSSITVKTAGGGGEVLLGEKSGIVAIRAGGRTIETAADGALWLHFTPPEPSRRIPVTSLLRGSADPALLKDAVLFVGTSAAGLRDLRATPFSPVTPGVEIHVEALEQMLLGAYLMRPDYATGLEFAFALVLGAGVTALVLMGSAYWALPVLTAGIALAVGTSWWAFTAERWLFDPLTPSLAAAAAFLTAAFVNYLLTESERRFVRAAFSHYLSPEVVDRIAQDPGKLRLGGETRELTIMFCDIRGFTTIAEGFREEPEALTRLINRILTPLTRVVLDHGGTIDKYIGDCIMAFWNAPLDDEDHAARACGCALDIIKALHTLNEKLASETGLREHPLPRIEVGIGINSGECVVGNMGSDLRFDYSVLGDAVNLAARLQTLSHNYGAAILVGEDTVERAGKGFTFLELDRVAVKGRKSATTVYALTNRAGEGRTHAIEAVAAFNQRLLEAYRARDFAASRQLSQEGTRKFPEFAQFYGLYATRSEEFERNPPNSTWDGTWVAHEK